MSTEQSQHKPFSILVGYDASKCSDAAIRGLEVAALPPEGTAFVMSVAETADSAATMGFGDVVLSPSDIAHYMRAVKDAAAIIARDGAAKVRAILPGWIVDAQAPEGTAYWSLLDHAERHHVDLIIVGSHGRSAIGRMMLGSTSQFVATHARCSVRIVRCGGLQVKGESRPPQLLIAIDGSPISDAVIDSVASRAWPAGTKAHLFTSVELGVSVAIQSRAAREPNRQMLDTPVAVLQHASKQLETVGLTVSTEFKVGNPKQLILEQAENRKSDVIFIGAQGHSRLERLCLGSVSAAVVARASCSVEVVRSRQISSAPVKKMCACAVAANENVAYGTQEMSCR